MLPRRGNKLREVRHCTRGHTAGWGQGPEAQPAHKLDPLCHCCNRLPLCWPGINMQKEERGNRQNLPSLSCSWELPEEKGASQSCVIPREHICRVRHREAVQKQVTILRYLMVNRSLCCSNIICPSPASLLQSHHFRRVGHCQLPLGSPFPTGNQRVAQPASEVGERSAGANWLDLGIR